MSRQKRSKSNASSKVFAENDVPTGNEKKALKKQILKLVTKILEKGPTGLRAEFQGMKRGNNLAKMIAFKAAQPMKKNRYKDVGCLDNSRVKLEKWPHEYIHANFVSTTNNSKRFICTQAPLESTCADFWWMCLQEKVETIFMLCNLVEKGAKKCHEYYPSKDKQDTMTFEEEKKEGEESKESCNKITVKYESSKNFKFRAKNITAKVIETILTIEGPNETSLKTTHYHWVDWPDRGVPAADMAIMELLEKCRQSKQPIAVHCSAGIGRTGSVVMIEYIMEQILSGQTVDETDKILVKIREQRNNSIQTDQQYLFVHQVLMNYFRNRKLLDDGIEKAHDEFTDKYDKLVIA